MIVGLLVAGLLPFLGAVLLNVVSGPRSVRAGWFASAFVFSAFILVCRSLSAGLVEPLTWSWGWIPELGLDLSMRADGLALLFALVISGIGVVVFTFAAAYLDAYENRRRFFCYLLTFMGAMMGVVLSANLIVLFVFWELTSLSSFLLIGFWHERQASRDGALKALVVTACGGLALLVGFIMIGAVCGSFDIQTVIARRELLTASPWAIPAACLVILGAITKSAQLPFHLWLPSAMEAPTPVSAFLHAATMVKAGLYLVARLGPLFADVSLWTPTLEMLGLLTMTWGGWMALRQKDLKALLAFSTVSQLGLILSLLAATGTEATNAGLLHLLNHAVFKGALFLLVGVIEHEAHTRDLMKLGPLRRKMPRTHLILALAALSMAGVPPFGGFVSKELFLEHALGWNAVQVAIALVGGTLTAAYCFALVFGLARGRGPAADEASHAHDPGLALLWGPGLLAVVALALGFYPQAIAGNLIDSAGAAASAGPAAHLHLALWHGVTPTLLASITVSVAGLGVWALWWQGREPGAPVLLVDRVYAGFLTGLETGARRLTESYMSGLVWRYTMVPLALVAVGLFAVMLTDRVSLPTSWPSRPPGPGEWVVGLGIAAAAFGTVAARTRIAAILSLGATGYLLALQFSLLGAPDLALTQLMVETVSVALFLTVFVYLPRYAPPSARRPRPGHMALATVFGLAAVSALYIVRSNRVVETISEYYVTNSVEKAGGHNIVNVILVDFRGLDTMGEVTVLGVAALACFAIIKLGRETQS